LYDTVLPLPLSCLADRLRVVFVGKEIDYNQGLSILSIRRSRVRAALQFLKVNCPVYRDVTIDDARLAELPEDGDSVCDAVRNLVVATGDEDDAVDSEGKSYVSDPLKNDDDNFGVDGLNDKLKNDDENEDAAAAADSEAMDEFDGDVPALTSTGVFGVDGVTSAQDVNQTAIPAFRHKIAGKEGPDDGDLEDSIPTDDNEFEVRVSVAIFGFNDLSLRFLAGVR